MPTEQSSVLQHVVTLHRAQTAAAWEEGGEGKEEERESEEGGIRVKVPSFCRKTLERKKKSKRGAGTYFLSRHKQLWHHVLLWPHICSSLAWNEIPLFPSQWGQSCSVLFRAEPFWWEVWHVLDSKFTLALLYFYTLNAFDWHTIFGSFATFNLYFWWKLFFLISFFWPVCHFRTPLLSSQPSQLHDRAMMNTCWVIVTINSLCVDQTLFWPSALYMKIDWLYWVSLWVFWPLSDMFMCHTQDVVIPLSLLSPHCLTNDITVTGSPLSNPNLTLLPLFGQHCYTSVVWSVWPVCDCVCVSLFCVHLCVSIISRNALN